MLFLHLSVALVSLGSGILEFLSGPPIALKQLTWNYFCFLYSMLVGNKRPFKPSIH